MVGYILETVNPTGVGLDQLARTLDSSKPTVHRALMALRRAGFAAHNGRGNYQLENEQGISALAYRR